MMLTDKSNYLFSRIACIFPYIFRANWNREKLVGKKIVKGAILKI